MRSTYARVLRAVSTEDIKKIVSSCKDSSAGMDDIPMKLFKDNIEGLADVVTYNCNLSLRTGIVPKNLMIAAVT